MRRGERVKTFKHADVGMPDGIGTDPRGAYKVLTREDCPDRPDWLRFMIKRVS